MASFTKPRFTRALLAAVDLSAKQFYYVGENGSGAYNVAGGATGAIGAGFLNNCPEAGETCEVMGMGGGAKAIASATVSGPEIELKADAAGTVSPATVAGDIVSAISKESAVSGDKFEVEPVYYRKHA